MKIKKVNIPKTKESIDGLADIKMDRLEQIVLIAGKNGSGKTRILNKIVKTVTAKPTKKQLENTTQQTKSLKTNIINYKETLAALQLQLTKINYKAEMEQLNQRIIDHENAIESSLNQVEQFEFIMNWDLIETTEISDNYQAIHFVPKILTLDDSNNFNKNQMVDKANAISQIGFNTLPGGVFSKIQVIQDRWFNSTHPKSLIPEQEQKNAIKEYENLEELVMTFLNTPLGRSLDDEATLFSFPMGKAQLSDGQKVLLQFCLAIYSQETALKDLVLIMDEPENHLHPSVIIETLDKITSIVPNGQIWIATHSIPLLSHYDPSQIWFVENSAISHAGRIPEKVLASLLGDDDEVAKLQDFISLPSQYATSRYAFECLFEPKVVETDIKDPQSVQIRNELLQQTSNEKLRVLDFGAGKGRIISNLFDLDSKDQRHVVDHIDYIAFDPDDKDKEYCKNSISRAYGDSANRYFNSMDNLLSVYDKESFNIVIMCNVLHEIEPKDWLKLFSNEGSITKLLSENGCLLLVEDHQLSIGEKAYQKGFLVLDTPQLKDLFKITEKDNGFSFVDARGDGRLKAHQIPTECLKRIDENSRLEALRAISKTAQDKIIAIRESEKNYKNGKIHGFWVQQFANAQLNLSELTAT